MRIEALQLLRRALGDNKAQFREGQWSAISALVERRARLLVVQRTGWGKSIVYFLATRLLRDRGQGCTLLISPLLSLMRNQILAAKNIGLRAETINSTNTADWPRIQEGLRRNEFDLLLISPERLGNEDFVNQFLLPISGRLGLFVVDEAHCISDWGHDFRPDYRRIVRVLRALPRNIPVLATTATANERVVGDIVDQLGPHLEVQRGSLTRASLSLQNIYLRSQTERMAWLANKPDLGFVIHFQRPSSVVHYYQQVGRAGRAVENAFGVLLNGEEDDAIAAYFLRTAFPSPKDVNRLLEGMQDAKGALTVAQLQQRVNLTAGAIEKVLKFLVLESPAPIQKTATGYVLNPVRWQMPVDRIERVANMRRREQERMKIYMASQRCLMQFLATELDDPDAEPCGKCAVCAGALDRKSLAARSNSNLDHVCSL